MLNTGSPVTMPWLDDVPAVLQMWFPGQEIGDALVDVLTGDAEPGGRLPMTFPARLEDTPAFAHYPGRDGRAVYAEGLFIGHRWYDREGIEPLFPFGFGLGYTTFEIGARRRSSGGVEHGVTVDVDVTQHRSTATAARSCRSTSSRRPATRRGPLRHLAGVPRVDLASRRAPTGRRSSCLAGRSPRGSTGRWVVPPGELHHPRRPLVPRLRAVGRVTLS